MAYNVTLSIPNISCGHCVMTVKRETKDLLGVISVDANVESKTASFVLENDAVLARVREALNEAGYPPAG